MCVIRSSSHSGGNHTQCSLCGSHTLGILCHTCCNWSSTVRTYIQQRVGYLCSDHNAVDSHFTAISVHARWVSFKMLLPVADETNGLAVAGIAGPSPLTWQFTQKNIPFIISVDTE